MTVVPSPNRLSISTFPLCIRMASRVAGIPNPVPFPIGFVVKNCSKTSSIFSLGMPIPLSVTLTLAYFPGVISRRLHSHSSRVTSTISVEKRMRPLGCESPTGAAEHAEEGVTREGEAVDRAEIASRELMARFSKTLSSLAFIPSTTTRLTQCVVSIRIGSLVSRFITTATWSTRPSISRGADRHTPHEFPLKSAPLSRQPTGPSRRPP